MKEGEDFAIKIGKRGRERGLIIEMGKEGWGRGGVII